tara:strand:- start:5453 stop:6502 length:1050 start_codon:yes stop_codon:yes gene_type:complete
MLHTQTPNFALPTLAMCPQPWYERSGAFMMYECKLKSNGELKWYIRFLPTGRADLYNDLKSAFEVATAYNSNIIGNIDILPITNEEKRSLFLKVEKAVMVQSRLINEEYLMLQEAIKRYGLIASVRNVNETLVPDNNERIRLALNEELQITPYIKIARLYKFGVTLLKQGDDDWTTSAKHTKKTAIICYREKVARGFDLSGADHWGKTKAKIRTMLLPRANQLLQLAGVKRMLAEALAKGQRVLLAGSFVFWYEEKGNIGWCIKEASDSDSAKNGNTLWREGKILSKNHGRIVVLPYIKENGEAVIGHTKNAPNDGKALPRHQDDFVELPFEVLEDDLMIGLFGELNYE